MKNSIYYYAIFPAWWNITLQLKQNVLTLLLHTLHALLLHSRFSSFMYLSARYNGLWTSRKRLWSTDALFLFVGIGSIGVTNWSTRLPMKSTNAKPWSPRHKSHSFTSSPLPSKSNMLILLKLNQESYWHMSHPHDTGTLEAHLQ